LPELIEPMKHGERWVGNFDETHAASKFLDGPNW